LLLITGDGSPISVAVAVPKSVSSNGVSNAVASKVTSAGTVRIGAVVSSTTIVSVDYSG